MSITHAFLILLLLLISHKDWKEGVIPDVYLVLLALLGFLHEGMAQGVSILILGLLAYSLYKIYPLLRGQEWLGWGDVKMITVAGIWLKVFQIPLFLTLSGSLGVGLALLWQALKKGPRFPLGPALAIALGICIMGDSGELRGENKMTPSFSGPSLAPASGKKPDSIVVLIHGYGANGDNLLPLGKAWEKFLPNTLFVAPHAPSPAYRNPFGSQWFALDEWDPGQKLTDTQLAQMVGEMNALVPSFNRYLDDLLKMYELPPEKLALVGFSQGAMVALYLAHHRPLCAGVVAYSGALLHDPSASKGGYPPVLLVHGIADPIVPASLSQRAADQLKALHMPVSLSLLPDLEHEIDPRGVDLGGAFLKEHLYKAHFSTSDHPNNQ